jgi:organic radical activating enzyme
MMSDKKYTYSEIFYSIQGEGKYTGVPTAWLRLFMCNLQCNGFGQKDPTDPSTYDLPFLEMDVSGIKRVEDLPVWEKGCDSSYTWAKKFKHLMGQATGAELAGMITNSMRNEFNPNGLFNHPLSKQKQHFCLTGGEPLMPHGQECFIDIFDEWIDADDLPGGITFETNGTQKLSDKFKSYIRPLKPEGFFSVSPKLWTVAGEKASKAIKPDIVAEYADVWDGQLKFVVGSTQREWYELDSVINQFRAAGVHYPVYIMPVGAREEEQTATAGDVARMAFQRGYNVSARVHVYLFGNAIGT